MDCSELLILGCGTSTGVPVPACGCRVCKSTDLRNKRLRTSALVSIGSLNILIDAGPDLRQQALLYNINHIDAVLFTHAHADHIGGVDDLRCFNFASKKPIPCFGSAITLEKLRDSFRYIFDPDPDWRGGMLPQLELNEFSHFQAFEVCGISVLPFALEHGSLTVTGFRIGAMAYATDCKLVPAESLAVLSNLDVLVLDALRDEAHNTHMTISEACSTAQKIAAKRTVFVHMTHSIDFQETSAKLPKQIELAVDGLRLKFSETF